MSEQTKDHGPEYRHVDDMPWETLRFPGQQDMKERKALSEENLQV